jgi:hypothetical protein
MVDEVELGTGRNPANEGKVTCLSGPKAFVDQGGDLGTVHFSK